MDLDYFGVPLLYQLLAAIFGFTLVCGFSTWVEWCSPARITRLSFRQIYLGRDLLICVLVLGYFGVIQGIQEFLKTRVILPPVPWPAGGAGVLLSIFLVFVVLDCSIYWVHRFMHIKSIWRVHRWHHGIQNVNWLSGLRSSFMELVVYAVPSFFLYLLFPQTLPWAILYALYSQVFIHMNLKVGPGFPSRWLVTPLYHRVHHAVDPRMHNKNFGTFWVVWDRWFGTLAKLDGVGDEFPLGLGEDPLTLRIGIGL